jgi:hypothetical protein
MLSDVIPDLSQLREDLRIHSPSEKINQVFIGKVLSLRDSLIANTTKRINILLAESIYAKSMLMDNRFTFMGKMIDKRITVKKMENGKDLSKRYNVREQAFVDLASEMKILEPAYKEKLDLVKKKVMLNTYNAEQKKSDPNFDLDKLVNPKEIEKHQAAIMKQQESALEREEEEKKRLRRLQDENAQESDGVDLINSWRNSLTDDEKLMHPMHYWSGPGCKWGLIKKLALRYLVIR